MQDKACEQIGSIFKDMSRFYAIRLELTQSRTFVKCRQKVVRVMLRHALACLTWDLII